MAKRNRLTNNSDETDIAALLSGDVVFSIPFFQRSYKWKPDRLKQLNEDIMALVDGESEFHFLGAVIIHGRRSNPSEPTLYEVIDGQQRITTLFLYVCAATKILAENEEVNEAAGLFLKYLAIPRETSLASNLKLHPCKEDRSQFNQVVEDLLKVKSLRSAISSSKFKFLPSSGKDKGILKNNYGLALRFFRKQFEEGGLERVRGVYQRMLECMSVVQIDVWDPTNGPKIFDSLNSRQEPMTIGDLVRNEIFSRVADEHPVEIEQIDQHSWQPFYQKFQCGGRNLFDSYFFPYGLIQNPNLRKSEVYTYLRDNWSKIEDPEDIINQLAVYQHSFVDLLTGSNNQGHSKSVFDAFANLHRLGAPSSTYPFLMQLSQANKDRMISDADTTSILGLIESFLVRRAICGHEPTGLHAVFKRLWVDCKNEYTAKNVENEIRKHKTVVWPDDKTFKESVETRALYGSAITNYFLQEYDKSLGGDYPENIPWVEHVLPENPVPSWFDHFTKDEHRDMKDRLANLIPLSKEMNQSLSNRIYSEKRAKYESDSMFKSSREFAREYDEWKPEQLLARGEKLAKWCAERWQY